VFVATFNQDYNRILNRDPDNTPKYQVTGNGSAILANRVSYFFDLKGVSFIVDTGCSGSMVALNQACQSIYNGESKQAIVGGSNIILDPVVQAGMSNLG
jgi:acyl transferase domain-containing protein